MSQEPAKIGYSIDLGGGFYAETEDGLTFDMYSEQTGFRQYAQSTFIFTPDNQYLADMARWTLGLYWSAISSLDQTEEELRSNS